MRMRECAAAVSLLAAGVVAGQAQDPQRPPTFRARVELITADVTVVDPDGRPVTDLSPADFTVRVDGVPRTIVSVQFVELSRRDAPKDKPAPLYTTNEGAGAGRLIAFVVDEGNIRAGGGRSALKTAARFLDTLTAADRVALFTIPGPWPRIPFTDDLDRVRAAFGRLNGRASTIEGHRFNLGIEEALGIAGGNRQTLQEAAARECVGVPNCDVDLMADAQGMADEVHERSAASLNGLAAVFSDLAAIEGPKTLVLISEGLLLDRQFGDLSDLAAAAATARVGLYALRLGTDAFDAGRPSAASGRDAQFLAEGLETLVGLARGASFTVTGTGAGVFERVARELAGYYLVAFEPGASDRDGKAHQIRIDVRRPSVTVRSRRAFHTADAAATAASADETLVRALRAPMLMTELPLRVSTYAFADGSGEKVRLAISAEIGRDRLAADEIGLAFALLDAGGRTAASGLQRQTLMPARAGEPGPLVYVGAIVALPGDYTLKLAAVDSEGRAGSIERPVRARLVETAGLRIADLVVSERDAGGASLRPPAVPRVGGDELVALLELYAARDEDLETAQVSIELAEAEDGPALVAAPAPFTGQRASGRRTAAASVNVALIPPGRYVARARVTAGGRPAGVASRPFELAAAPRGIASTPAPPDAPSPGAGSASPAPPIDVSTMVEPFRRESLLGANTVRTFVDELVSNLRAPLPPRLEPAVDEARSGRLAGAASKASEPSLHPVATFLRGLAAFERGDLDPAASLFRSTLHGAPGSFAAMVYLAACYAVGGRDDEAAGAWHTSLVGFDDTPIVYALLSDAALRSGDRETALATLKEAGTLWPDDDRFVRRLALVLLAARRPADAYAAFDRYLARRPDDEVVLLQATQGIYQVALTGAVVESPAQDLARARRYAAEYERVKGAQQALVKAWLAYLERRE